MKKIRAAQTVALVVLAWIASPAFPDDPQEIVSTKTTFPPVKLACIPFLLPIDAAEAKSMIEQKQKEWFATARAAKLSKSGYPFVDAKIDPPPKDPASDTAVPIAARTCAVVEESVSTVAGMEVESSPEVDGFAGFCIASKVEDCLMKSFTESGFMEKRPWPRLPIYARWPDDVQDPTDVGQVTVFLSTATRDIPPDMTGQGETYERNTNGLTPVVPCDTGGCPQQTLLPPEESKQIAWFIPTPEPSPPPKPPAVADTPKRPG